MNAEIERLLATHGKTFDHWSFGEACSWLRSTEISGADGAVRARAVEMIRNSKDSLLVAQIVLGVPRTAFVDAFLEVHDKSVLGQLHGLYGPGCTPMDFFQTSCASSEEILRGAALIKPFLRSAAQDYCEDIYRMASSQADPDLVMALLKIFELDTIDLLRRINHLQPWSSPNKPLKAWFAEALDAHLQAEPMLIRGLTWAALDSKTPYLPAVALLKQEDISDLLEDASGTVTVNSNWTQQAARHLRSCHGALSALGKLREIGTTLAIFEQHPNTLINIMTGPS